MNEFLNTFDLLKEYNVAKGDPLGADYDEMAIDLADGKPLSGSTETGHGRTLRRQEPRRPTSTVSFHTS